MSTKKIFISHAFKDKPLIDAFEELLILGSLVPPIDIYCTSCPNTVLKPGEDFIRNIKAHIQDAPLIILLLSPNFYDSEFCLGELGATWALDTQIFPIVIPDKSITEIKGILSSTHLGMISDKGCLHDLYGIISVMYNNKPDNIKNWSYQCDKFQTKLPAILQNLPKPSRISSSEYEELKGMYEIAKDENSKLEVEIERLNKLIDELKLIKDADKIDKVIFDNLPETQQFDQLVDEAKRSLWPLDQIVKEAIYYYLKGDPLIAEDYLDLASDAVDKGFLNNEDVGYSPNTEDGKVIKALQAIGRLEEFLDNSSEQFYDQFYQMHDYKPLLSNKRFWQDFLKLIR